MTPIVKLIGIAAVLASGLDINTPPPSATEIDYGRSCLALVGFAEARDQSDAGLAMTMQVVINRATDPAHRWPGTLCDAALQPGQFLGLDQWPTPRQPERINPIAWQRALDMADQIIAHTAPVPILCVNATSFNQSHATDSPDFLCRIGAHTFFRDPTIAIAAQ